MEFIKDSSTLSNKVDLNSKGPDSVITNSPQRHREILILLSGIAQIFVLSCLRASVVNVIALKLQRHKEVNTNVLKKTHAIQALITMSI